ncbi:MAG: FAD-binding protein, partial [Acidimicrobiia bacterium]|nr:FAD-binding protein [Acidimicrobiia bacterium]
SSLEQAAAAAAQTRTSAADRARQKLAEFEARHGRTVRVRATGGVVLSSGGYVFARELMQRYGGPYADTAPLGTIGDDGAALRLGEAVGAATGQLDRYAASRFICPPDAFVCGVLVNSRGERICDETLYGATLSANIVESGGGTAYLVIDHDLWLQAKEDMRHDERLRTKPPWRVLSGRENHVVFRKGTAWLNRWVNRSKARTLRKLARRADIDAAGLEATVARYNADAAGGARDAEGKDPKYVRALTSPPYYAIDVSVGSVLFPAPCLTLGGLRVEGRAGAVRDADGSTVPGLYAAGRAAVGISSRSYVSGLSTADCVFSGRNAGRAAATAAATAPA